jgi:hypothetical protein
LVCRLWWFGRDCCLIVDNFKKKICGTPVHTPGQFEQAYIALAW